MSPCRSLFLAMALALAACASAPPSSPAVFADGRLAAPTGMTLYVYDRDPVGSDHSACGEPCRYVWPPFMASSGDQPFGGYTLVQRDEGGRQWAYQGRPLYLHRNDQKSNDRTGDKAATAWHIVPQM